MGKEPCGLCESRDRKSKKHAENGCAMVEDETVYSWIREYYGIAEEPKTDNIISLDLADLL